LQKYKIFLGVTFLARPVGWNSFEIILPLVVGFRSLQTKYQRSTPRRTPENLAQSDPPPVDLSAGDIRSQIAAEWYPIHSVASICGEDWGGANSFFDLPFLLRLPYFSSPPLRNRAP